MKTEILAALRSETGHVSGQELCEKLGVSRTAVWKEIQKLRMEGYQIEAVSNKGYHLTEAPDVLNEEELSSLRKTAWAGKEIVYYDVTDSTNIQAKRLGEEGWPHGTLVVAGRQEAGRLAAGGLYHVCHIGTLPHVCRSHRPGQDSQSGYRVHEP